MLPVRCPHLPLKVKASWMQQSIQMKVEECQLWNRNYKFVQVRMWSMLKAVFVLCFTVHCDMDPFSFLFFFITWVWNVAFQSFFFFLSDTLPNTLGCDKYEKLSGTNMGQSSFYRAVFLRPIGWNHTGVAQELHCVTCNWIQQRCTGVNLCFSSRVCLFWSVSVPVQTAMIL